jgi:hypothetical protein
LSLELTASVNISEIRAAFSGPAASESAYPSLLAADANVIVAVFEVSFSVDAWDVATATTPLPAVGVRWARSARSGATTSTAIAHSAVWDHVRRQVAMRVSLHSADVADASDTESICVTFGHV